MSGRGKGGKGLGKGGKYLGKGGLRHRQVARDPELGIERPALRRLARRAGVKRIAGDVYGESRGVAKDFLDAILRDAISVSRCSNRKTVAVRDVLFALTHHQRKVYGFDEKKTHKNKQ
jgi:histone H4